MPSDWLRLGERPEIAPGFKPRFSYDAVRIPLYLIWAKLDSPDNLRPFNEFWGYFPFASFVPRWTVLADDSFDSYDAPPGIRAVISLTRLKGTAESRQHELRLPKLNAGEDYYSASLFAARQMADHRKRRAMKLPRSILIFASIALLGMAGASWGAEPVPGRNYYSVQLLSARSAAALQESLARVAQQPHARIEKRGADFALQVGLWESRADAEQALEAFRQDFRGAFVLTVTYRSDSTVPAERPQTRASVPRGLAAVQGAGASEVLSLQRKKQGLLPSRTAGNHPAPPLASARAARTSVRCNPCWPQHPISPLLEAVGEERYSELDTDLAAWQSRPLCRRRRSSSH